MTKKEFLAVYGNVKVTFQRYYKYTFSFSGTLENGDTLECFQGNYVEDIYKFEVIYGKEILVSELDPYKGFVYRNGEIIAGFDRW